MSISDKNRRRNQIIAERAGDAARSRRHSVKVPDRQLWQEVDAALDRAEATYKWLGHVNNHVEMVIARESLAELKMRGVQASLPIE